MRKFMFMAAVAMLVVPSAALAHNGKPAGVDKRNAVGDCETLKASLGTATFRQTFPASSRSAFGKCVSQMAREEHENRHNAAQACRAERETIGEEAFRAKYGTNRNGASAFGRCVSSTRRAEAREDREDVVNAAQECKAERELIGEEAFRAKYGTNRNQANAFGKCVSTLAQAKDEEESAES